jgi:hypothetical protein
MNNHAAIRVRWGFTALLGFLALFLVSCSSQITGRISQDASAAMELSAGLEPNTAALIRSFVRLQGSGAPQNPPVLDSALLNRSLQAAPGIKSSALRNTAPEKITGTIAITRIGDFLKSGTQAGQGFIRYEAPSAAAPGKLAVHLDRALAPRVLLLISPEITNYLSVLLAPAATGEVLTNAEYLDLVSSVYGKGVAGEISQAKINAVISFPGQIQSITGGRRSSGREARFEIPLIDLLVLSKPLDYEVTWK